MLTYRASTGRVNNKLKRNYARLLREQKKRVAVFLSESDRGFGFNTINAVDR